MKPQYLTAVFKLRPTRRKAAALERVRALAEASFWAIVDAVKDRAVALAAVKDRKERKEGLRMLSREVLALSLKTGLAEPVAMGLQRDVDQAISSYVELTAAAHPAEYPSRQAAQEVDHHAALDQLAAAVTDDEVREAQHAVARSRKAPAPRPIVIARARDACFVQNAEGRIAVVLHVLRASDARSCECRIDAGVDPTTGEVIKAGKSRAKLVMPLECSRWHENKFLDGRAKLRSSLIFRRDDEWFLAAQFEMPVAQAKVTDASLGIDRGVVYPVAAAVVDGSGNVIVVAEPAGREIGERIDASERRRREQQRRRGISTLRHKRFVQDVLHRMANDIVSLALKHGAVPVLEKLDGLKSTIKAKRENGCRKGGWRKCLKKAQLGELERIVTYKLNLAGIPQPQAVFAGGSSQTCRNCGHRDPENRVTRDVFKCVCCGHEEHADSNAGVIVARRGILMRNIKKGQKLDELHKDMVRRLNSALDSGCGRTDDVVGSVVHSHAAAVGANEVLVQTLTPAAGQNATQVGKNLVVNEILAERVDGFCSEFVEKDVSDQLVATHPARQAMN